MDGGEATVERQLTRLEHEFAEGALSGDYSRVEGLLAPEFVGVDPWGRELTRAEVLADLRSPNRHVEALGHENIRVRVFGDCAVVLAVTVVKWRHQGELMTGEFPYMRVWIRREGCWLAVATQSSASAR